MAASNVIVPTAPRAMIHDNGTEHTPSAYEQILQDVRSKIYPKLVLLEAFAPYKDNHKRRLSSNDKFLEARRDFLDSFAYLCDIKRGGSTVTATALQQLLCSNILWLAANEGISRDVKTYAESILQSLKRMTASNRLDIQTLIFENAVEKCQPRLDEYKGYLQKHARNCRMQLRKCERSVTVQKLRAKFKKLSEPLVTTVDMDLVDSCYSMRGPEINEILKFSTRDDDDFRKVAHYIGRIGATRSSVNSIVDATLIVSDLKNIAEIRVIEAPEPRSITIDQEWLSPYEIVRAICAGSISQNPVEIQRALEAIVIWDFPRNDPTEARRKLTARKTLVTRVHAELQIVDRFSRIKGMDFVGGDKYIGCSKPACYFCFNWLSSHKHNYVPPATHNKVIPGCRAPDERINDAGSVVMREMYSKLSRKLDQDILDWLLNHGGMKPSQNYQFMSTEGSSRVPSQVSSGPLQHDRRFEYLDLQYKR